MTHQINETRGLPRHTPRTYRFDSDGFSSDQDIIINMHPAPPMHRTQFRRYVLQHYMQIIKYLIIIIFALIMLVIWLVIQSPSDSSVMYPKSGDRPGTDVIKYSDKNNNDNNDDNNNNVPLKIKHRSKRSFNIKYYDFDRFENQTEDDYQADRPYSKVTCQKIHCFNNDTDCNIPDISYYSIKRYSCCKCLPKDFVMKRYCQYLTSGMCQLVLQHTTDDPRFYSEYDLKLLPKLKYISGTWDVVADSDTAFWLVYSGVALDSEGYGCNRSNVSNTQ